MSWRTVLVCLGIVLATIAVLTFLSILIWSARVHAEEPPQPMICRIAVTEDLSSLYSAYLSFYCIPGSDQLLCQVTLDCAVEVGGDELYRDTAIWTSGPFTFLPEPENGLPAGLILLSLLARGRA